MSSKPLTVGSLFAGIGGFDLGFERAGMRTVWFCEQDPYCQAVLAKHWPGVPCYDDVRALVADSPGECGSGEQSVHHAGWSLVCPVAGASGRVGGRHSAAGTQDAQRAQIPGDAGDVRGSLPVPVSSVDILCGGFPCQDLSSAGKQAGLTGERSGLWFEYLRLVGELRPRYVVVENVPQLRKYLDVVTGGLAEIGYDAEWDVISAADFGAPHLRKRLWLVAYPQRSELREQPRRCRGQSGSDAAQPAVNGEAQSVADADEERRDGRSWHKPEENGWTQPSDEGWWTTEPDVGRVAHGVPARVDRLRALGNALVPQIAEYIGHRIVSYETRP